MPEQGSHSNIRASFQVLAQEEQAQNGSLMSSDKPSHCLATYTAFLWLLCSVLYEYWQLGILWAERQLPRSQTEA